MNKNLIYFSVNERYIECLNFNLTLIKKITPGCFDVCCIIPKGLDGIAHKIHTFGLPEPFNLHSSRFSIVQWENFENYNNFLYLDADAVLVKSPNMIFDVIERQPEFIHGVKEKENISDVTDSFFRFTTDDIYGYTGFNSGTFGFNRKMKNVICEFIEYINANKHMALNDQPLYNEFFNGKKNILPTLSNFVYLKDPIRLYDINKINMTSKHEATIIHFLGRYGDLDYKLTAIKEEFKQ